MTLFRPREAAAGSPDFGLRSRLERLFPRSLIAAAGDALPSTIYGFILRHSRREQIYLVVVTLLSFPFLYYSLELPKVIINQAIAGKNFPWTILGIEFSRIWYLVLLCFVFLVFVLINGWFKYHLNVRKGRVGERMLRRLRYDLYERLLRFPMRHFDRTAAGEIIAMLTAELEPVGGFIGDAFALPIAQAGTLLTIFVFMFVQNPLLGAAAVALYPVQAFFIPRMQRRIRALGRLRVRKVRTLSDRIGESIAAQVEIRTNAGAQHQLADISHRLGEIYDIRFDIYNRKFFVKFLNNLINQLTPFFFYLIGGYFVITGELSFGALVAVLAAYKELSSPWKELLDFYQNQQDVAIKYEQVVEQFHVADMLDPRLLFDEGRAIEPPQGELELTNVSLVDSDGIRLLDGLSLACPLGTHVALVGPSNGGKNLAPQLLARLSMPSGGQITLGAVDLASLSFAASGRLIGYVGPATHLFSATIRENLLLGLRYRPEDSGAAVDKDRLRAIEEARSSGNCKLDIGADWIDYRQAGVEDAAALERRLLEIVCIAGLERDLYRFGLRSQLDPERHPDAAERLLEARRRFDQRLTAKGLVTLVERFDAEHYNASASIAANLLFGTSIGPTFADGGLAENAYVRRVLDEAGLTEDLVQAGHRLAGMIAELFGDLPPGHALLEEFDIVGGEDITGLERIVARAERDGLDGLPESDRTRLLGLALRLVAARDRLGLVGETMRQRILAARHAFAAGLPEELRGAVEFFDAERYNPAMPVEENILFGTILSGESDALERVHGAIGEVLDELGLRALVTTVGLDYPVGTGGSRLLPAQRQQIAIGRAVLKRPVLLALDEATAVLDPAAETTILDALRHEFAGRSILAALSRPDAARGFDRVVVIDRGRLVDEGDYQTLARRDRSLAPLLAAE
jgi:putative ABC transport system ATP-binding protein